MVESHEIEASAKMMLCNRGYNELKKIVCQYDQCDCTLTLRGQVAYFYWKQIAQESVQGIMSVERVINMIDVADK